MTAETRTLWPVAWEIDDGHGWLVVPLASCAGVRVSEYSYVDRSRGLAYLEEDCDAWAWAEAHPWISIRSDDTRVTFHQGDAPCRSLPRFRPTVVGGAS